LAGLAPEKTIKKSPTTFVIRLYYYGCFSKPENSNRKGVTILQPTIDQ
jgi:hypothetical protein